MTKYMMAFVAALLLYIPQHVAADQTKEQQALLEKKSRVAMHLLISNLSIEDIRGEPWSQLTFGVGLEGEVQGITRVHDVYGNFKKGSVMYEEYGTRDVYIVSCEQSQSQQCDAAISKCHVLVDCFLPKLFSRGN